MKRIYTLQIPTVHLQSFAVLSWHVATTTLPEAEQYWIFPLVEICQLPRLSVNGPFFLTLVRPPKYSSIFSW